MTSISDTPDIVSIAGGSFQAGSDDHQVDAVLRNFRYAFAQFEEGEARKWLLKQCPRVERRVESFGIGKYPVTNAEFSKFELAVFGATRRSDLRKPRAPVEGPGFYESMAYCQWLSLSEGLLYRLPSETEWEYAASSRGTTIFPWGNEFSPERVNTAESAKGETEDVDAHPSGASAQGVFDLGGNVEEWTSSVYFPYEGASFVEDHITDEKGIFYPVLRGGSYAHHGDLCLAARRHGFRDNYSVSGLRIATSFHRLK